MTVSQSHISPGDALNCTWGEMRCFERTLFLIEVSIAPAQSMTPLSKLSFHSVSHTIKAETPAGANLGANRCRPQIQNNQPKQQHFGIR